MNNSISFIDSVQYSCVVNDRNIILSNSFGKHITADYNQKVISYMIKGTKDKKTVWEMGVGRIATDNGLVVTREEFVASSNDKFLNLDGYDCMFYIVPNSSNYNSGFNNVLVHEDGFSIDPVSSIHILDCNQEAINAILPPVSKSKNIVLEIKNLRPSCVVYILCDNSVVDFLSEEKSYIKLACDGKSWTTITDNTFLAQQSEQSVSVQSDSTGDAGSLQYADGAGGFSATNIYYDSTNKNVLLGANTESNAYSIISTTGNPTVFNKNYTNADFIVYGSGSKNMYWSGRQGRFGINIPPGSSPASPLHLINVENCSELLRVENRNPNTRSNLTLYHRPSILPATGTVCSTINFNSRDNTNSTINLAQIKGTVLGNTAYSTSGQLSFAVDNSGTLNDKVVLNDSNFNVHLYDTQLLMSATGINIHSSLINIPGPVHMPQLIMDAGVISFTGIPSDCAYDYGPPPTLTPTPTPTPTPIDICPIDYGSGSGSGSGSGASCELNTIIASIYIDENDKEYLQIQGAIEIGDATAARRTVYIQDSTSYEPENTEAFFPVIYTTSPLQVRVQPYTEIEPFAISGHYPLFTTTDNATAWAIEQDGTLVNSEIHVQSHVFYGYTYYMPDLASSFVGTYTGANTPVPDLNMFALNNQHHVLVNGRRIHQYVGDTSETTAYGYNLNFLGVFWKTLNSDGNFDTNT